MNLTKNFTLKEMLKSQVALRWGFHEQFTPPEDVIENLRKLCTNVLQPIRDEIGSPITVTSGYRCPRVNAAVNGRYDVINKDGSTKVVQTSQHVKGEAADIELWVGGKEHNDRLVEVLRNMAKDGFQFDQLIKEYGGIDNPEWVHISYRENRLRNQVLHAKHVGKKTTYVPVLL